MSQSTRFIIGALVVLVVIVGGGMIFTVDQTKQAIVLQFGELSKVHEKPGLKFKLPFIQEVLFYEKLIINADFPEVRITTGDQKRLLVDTYTRYRIINPVLFFQTVKPATEQGASMRLEFFVTSTVRNVLGKVPLRNLLSEERPKIMKSIEKEVDALARPLGIQIVDVRIIRTELPMENRDAVFNRMISALNQIAKGNRATGEKIGQEIRSAADRDQSIILATAQQKAQDIRGQGEAKSIQILGSALGKNPSFYGFYRTMQTYRETLGEGTTLVLTTDNDLFRYFNAPERELKN
ncbi:MAG: protease modulator HflC [Alphaproteobacteria bacterium]|jgi:membrane protease subunit HflC|nr:protease modulator HflC [Alphaproteobacteria bacterium]